MFKEKNTAVREGKKGENFIKISYCLFQKDLMEMTDFA